MVLGHIEIIALSDGTIPQNFHQLLSNTKTGEIDSLLKNNYQQDPVELSVNAYLLKLNGKLILIDAGTANAYGPSLGHLTEALNRVGYKPEQIDAVLITHMHIDHTGGLMNGTRLAFPNATVYVSQPEADFWLSEKNKDSAPAGMRPYFQQAESTVGPYLKAGKLKIFSYNNELFPGLMPIASPGHTPGHSFYKLISEGQTLLFCGDLFHAGAIQFKDPGVTIAYDVNPVQAARQRKETLADAAKRGYWLAGDHLSFPGIGHVIANGNGYTWIPINYSAYGSGK
jgi:glyoxylase-like metal-dependent hydrolase (beta-lactamase superfamily II)